jgi:hypothetical protein
MVMAGVNMGVGDIIMANTMAVAIIMDINITIVAVTGVIIGVAMEAVSTIILPVATITITPMTTPTIILVQDQDYILAGEF